MERSLYCDRIRTVETLFTWIYSCLRKIVFVWGEIVGER
jgi:hypothetical protein